MTEDKMRCVVTGMGMITAIGKNVDECYTNAINSVSGIKETKTVDTTGCYANLAAEVDDDLEDIETPEYMDRASKLCIKAANEAMADAGLSDFGGSERVSVVIGSCVGGVVSIEHYYKNNKDPKDVKQMPISAIANQLAGHVHAGGAVTNIANACAAGTISISYACDLIREGKADVVLAGGADAFASVPFAGFLALHALSSEPCSPFNHCVGITLGEGSGIVIVESYNHAKARGAKMYCEVLGAGISSDAHHITAPRPDGEGQINCINWAIENSGVDPSEIGYVNAHGTGTAKNDSAEFVSLHAIFDGKNSDLSVSSTKAMVGHCLGAAGAVEAVFTIKALTTNKVLPTLGFSGDDFTTLKEKAGDIDFVPNTSRSKNLTTVMSNNYAFGGNNASIIFSKNQGNVLEHKPTRAAITGFGVVSPMGNDLENYINKYNEGAGVTEASNHSAVTQDDYKALNIPMSFYRKLDTVSQYESVSGMYALKNAGITVTDENATSIGVVVGTSEGALGMGCVFEENIAEKGNAAGSAFKFPNTVYNAAGGYFSICSGIKGYNVTITNGAQSGLQALSYAKTILDEEKSDIVLASGLDENIEVTTELYNKLGYVASTYVKPYSESNGFALSDGAITLVVESEKSVANRGVKPYAYIAGSGMAHHAVSFGTLTGSGAGLEEAIQLALKDAKLDASQIDAIYGFADGFKPVDELEIKAYKNVFGDASMPIVAVKERMGEARAAAAATAAMEASLLLAGKISEAKAYFMNNTKEETKVLSSKVKNILVTAFGSGGSYTAVILTKE